MGERFTGEVYLASMIRFDPTYNFPNTNNINFAPRARSSWHTHGGMIILGTGGVGYYQEEGKPAQIIRSGDVVQCPAGVRHWHGAAANSWFSQMVIWDSDYQGVNDQPATPVTDEEYAAIVVEEQETQISTDNLLMFRPGEEPMISPNFTGPYYLSQLLGENNVAGSPALHYVVFESGVRNHWHIHEGGQILIVTDGVGYHQLEGDSIKVLHPGDVVYCPPGVKHWHGADLGGRFAHIAVNTNPEKKGVTWLDAVADLPFTK